MAVKLPSLSGIIRRRILINYRADAEVVQGLLPAPFTPKLHDGHAIVGICLIRLENIRPSFLPFPVGINSENAAHRIAVQWNENGRTREGVYIPRRDTGSLLNRLAGGRLFPGQHHGARFAVKENDAGIQLEMKSTEDDTEVRVQGTFCDELPAGSCFSGLETASRFFESGNLGFSARSDGDRLDAIRLETKVWHVRALRVEEVYSSWYATSERFPADSIEFDHALIMQNIPHQWHSAETPVCAGGRS